MRIAHCSDLHLLSLAGARALDFANKRWIGGMNLLSNRGRHYHAEVFAQMVEDMNRQRLDHIVVTGDITNLAFEEEYRFARTFFDQLALPPEHVTVLPGNHDAYVAKGAEYFARHFDAFNQPDPEFLWPAADGEPEDRWPVVRVRKRVAIIGLSTSLATPWFTAWGEVGARQLQRLREILTSPALAGMLRVVAIHHPPAGARAKSRIRGLRDRDAFAAVLAEAGCDLVLHGHEHIDLVGQLPGPGGQAIPVRGIQSATYEAGKVARRARYRIYDVADPAGEPPRIASERVRMWDPEGETFLDEPPELRAAVSA